MDELDRLIEEQGVKPVENWDDLLGGWPEGADFDAFMAAIRSTRACGDPVCCPP